MSGRFRNAYWPDVSTRAGAERTVRKAALAAYFVAGGTALASFLSMFGVLDIVSPWFIVSAVVFAALGFFISRGSRLAAAIATALYVLGSVINLIGTSGNIVFLAVALTLTMYLVNGIRGASSLRAVPEGVTGGVRGAREVSPQDADPAAWNAALMDSFAEQERRRRGR